MIKLRFGNAFLDEPFIVAAPFVILVFTRSRRHFVSSRTRHRIPAFGFGGGFENGFCWINVWFTRQFSFGLFAIGFRRISRRTTIDNRQFSRTSAHHLTGDSADAGGIFGQSSVL